MNIALWIVSGLAAGAVGVMIGSLICWRKDHDAIIEHGGEYGRQYGEYSRRCWQWNLCVRAVEAERLKERIVGLRRVEAENLRQLDMLGESLRRWKEAYQAVVAAVRTANPEPFTGIVAWKDGEPVVGVEEQK